MLDVIGVVFYGPPDRLWAAIKQDFVGAKISGLVSYAKVQVGYADRDNVGVEVGLPMSLSTAQDVGLKGALRSFALIESEQAVNSFLSGPHSMFSVLPIRVDGGDLLCGKPDQSKALGILRNVLAGKPGEIDWDSRIQPMFSGSFDEISKIDPIGLIDCLSIQTAAFVSAHIHFDDFSSVEARDDGVIISPTGEDEDALIFDPCWAYEIRYRAELAARTASHLAASNNLRFSGFGAGRSIGSRQAMAH